MPLALCFFSSYGQTRIAAACHTQIPGDCTLSFKPLEASTLKDMPAGLNTASSQKRMWRKAWGQGLRCQFKGCTMGQASTCLLKSLRAPARQKCHLMLHVSHAQHSHIIWQHRGRAAFVYEPQKPPETWKEQRTQETKLLLPTYLLCFFHSQYEFRQRTTE